ncbi:MAG: efflux RND transporter periplasmic adaptor subunit [Betaproteobacteria bacterium]|nr:efflux RND transporter periplasmic adaptor subunit [Betaproteobacteria bacterium]
MRLFWKISLVICVLAAGAGLYWWTTQPNAKPIEAASGKVAKAAGKGAAKRGGGTVSVRTVNVTRQAMPVVIDAVGTVEAEHSVAVRPQVNGVLESVMFKEGDRVKQGQPLFRIDPRSMQAAVEQARATVARDQAQLVQAQAQEARLRPLIEKDYITRQEYDVAATQAKALDATATSNQAVLQQALLQLSYAQITAPISGRTGSLSVKAGNLVAAGTGGIPLVVINSTQPILVSLSVPQRYLDDVRRAWNTPELKVEISANPGAPAVATGALVFIDNAVNPQTGTIVLKARVKNEKEELWPGQFVAARIILRIEKDAFVLPEGAVQPGQDGPFVYVVRDGKAQIQNVVIDRQIAELVVISKGLTGSEEIIAEVPPTLTVGTEVSVRGPGREGGTDGGKRKGGKSNESPAKEAAGKAAKS